MAPPLSPFRSHEAGTSHIRSVDMICKRGRDGSARATGRSRMDITDGRSRIVPTTPKDRLDFDTMAPGGSFAATCGMSG